MEIRTSALNSLAASLERNVQSMLHETPASISRVLDQVLSHMTDW